MLMERGVLVRWNDEKGFGFIQPDKSGDRDVFIHISVLKKMARKPKVGDSILYQTEVQNGGKIKAVIASIEGVAVLAANPTSSSASRTPLVNRGNKSANTKRPQTSLNRLISILLLVAIAGIGYKAFQQRQETIIEEKPATYSEQPQRTVEPQFHCEAGKTHCSHMRSCAEATFYIQNCPNTQMDGDGDGIPCESQWCSSSML
ncbi:excalibur calcium-binding domain-containing protein [Shewanella xiamenensis]|uniref:excalibur calcium-binding domain-containing protein n=1 Tax=Shewanella xiamenensis TaxID=332186 RepID=UPI00166A8736|nr:excalibur calcium-binding domain-containing protein [Shewanella xiamenensis]MCL1069563.1 excalibur calcium-binding domain-containing protein [Shewanella xiamenensis]MCR4534221.1 excalibur calcium-binding domain-containing protein [Shewanella xiamenensis]WHF56262.1 excalibur calcium-binding domain-containing protein [Shewanella xiamenensis]GGM84255.1 cold-shock protein [Shewanella xiamenensis]